jgi:hypothetical protein
MRAGDDVMKSELPGDRTRSLEQAMAAQFANVAETGEVQAWEEVDAGRYMPRRIKGSCKGRALG